VLSRVAARKKIVAREKFFSRGSFARVVARIARAVRATVRPGRSGRR
jgi:hypothetical protein